MATHSSGSAKVRVETRGIDRLASRIRSKGISAAARAIREEVESVTSRAAIGWGRQTGEGARSLGVKVAVVGTRIIVTAFSTDPTARYHRPSGSRETYWERLVAGPLRRFRQRILSRSSAAMAREVDRG